MSGSSSNQGNQNTALNKIENEEERLISYSKRRTGLYKKVSELHIQCGGETGILIFSPSGNPFTYGIPRIDAVFNRFRGKGPQFPENDVNSLLDTIREARVEQLTHEVDELTASLHLLRKDGNKLSENKAPIHEDCWWETDLEDLTNEQMDQLKESMEEIKRFSTKMEEQVTLVNDETVFMNPVEPNNESTSNSGLPSLPKN